jgi:hypothetical protein
MNLCDLDSNEAGPASMLGGIYFTWQDVYR